MDTNKNEHRPIIAVDFDGTLTTNNYPHVGEANERIFEYLKERILDDKAYVILWTCRQGKELEEAIRFCDSHGVKFDAVNDNLPHIKSWFGHNPRKVFANEYIDDLNKFMSHVPFVVSADGDVSNVENVEVEISELRKQMSDLNINYKYQIHDMQKQHEEELLSMTRLLSKEIRDRDRIVGIFRMVVAEVESIVGE